MRSRDSFRGMIFLVISGPSAWLGMLRDHGTLGGQGSGPDGRTLSLIFCVSMWIASVGH